MWSYWLGKIKQIISNSDELAEAKQNESLLSREQDFNTSYFFTKIGSWQHLIELFIASNILALVIALAEAGSWGNLHFPHVFEYIAFINWVLLAFVTIIDQVKNKLRYMRLSIALLLVFIVLQIITLLTTVVLNLAQYWGRFFSFQYLNIGIVLNHASLNLSYGILLGAFCIRYFYVLNQWYIKKNSETNARLQALQARIHPHFLFNSLNSAVSLIHLDPDKAEMVLINLSRLFRASFQEFKLVSLQEELDICRKYIEIEELRLGDRVNIEWKLPEQEHLNQVQIPLLTLQPLIENSIFHGVEHNFTCGSIGVLVEILRDQVTIVITNPNTLDKINTRQGHGIALENVRQRLKAHFGYSVQFQNYMGNGFFTTLIRYQYK
nr:histidine kinase [Acinetobacter sp. Marseille-Q1620]